MKLTAMVGDLVRQFGDSAEMLFNEVCERCTLHEQFWKLVRYDVTPEYTLVDKFKGMIEIYKKDLWLQSNTKRPT